MNLNVNLFLILVCLCLGASAAANSSDETKPLEMPDFSKVKNSSESAGGVKLKSSCRTSTGRTLTKNEPGYEACMSAAQIELSKKHGTSVGPQTGSAAGLNFEIGK